MAHFLYVATRLPLALLFVYTGAVKLLDIGGFAQDLGAFGLVPDALVVPTAWAVAPTEVVLGIALAAGVRSALAGCAALLVLFVGVLTYGLALGLDIDCGCLGPDVSVGLATQRLIDLGLLGWCLLVYFASRRSPGKVKQ